MSFTREDAERLELRIRALRASVTVETPHIGATLRPGAREELLALGDDVLRLLASWRGLNRELGLLRTERYGEALVHAQESEARALYGLDAVVAVNKRLAGALRTFAEQDECGIGCSIGEDDDHTAQCDECRRILDAREAITEAENP